MKDCFDFYGVPNVLPWDIFCPGPPLRGILTFCMLLPTVGFFHTLNENSAYWSRRISVSGGGRTRSISFNPYSAKSLGYRLYETLHKMPGEIGNYFVYFWSRKTLPYTHLEDTSYISQQGKALTSEPLPYFIQAVKKISTLYNFYEWRI